jgi:GNAT superfamily N-acetyltransferase
MSVRDAYEREVDQLAQMWYVAWRDGHANLLPPELIRVRTLESFRDRAEANLASFRVIGAVGAPMGLCSIKGEELYQLFVAAQARGTGAAGLLVADAEERLARNGVETAWLSCAIGNVRAARFYEKCGWRRAGNMVGVSETSEGPFMLESWRFEKRLIR